MPKAAGKQFDRPRVALLGKSNESNRLLTSMDRMLRGHGDDHYYIRRSGIHGPIGFGNLFRRQWKGITRQARRATAHHGDSFSNRNDAEWLSPRIDLVIGFNGERLAGPGRMCYVLTKDRIAHLLGIRCCIKHLGVTLKFLRVFLVCLNPSLAFVGRRSMSKQRVQTPLTFNRRVSCNLCSLTTKDSLTQRSLEGNLDVGSLLVAYSEMEIVCEVVVRKQNDTDE